MSPPHWQSTGYWSTLGLKNNATVEEVRSAYKKLALTVHPDKVPDSERDEATEKFKVLKTAYDFCLVSATIRPEHDKLKAQHYGSFPWPEDDIRSTPWPADDDNSNSSPWPDDNPNSSDYDPRPPPPSPKKPHKPPRERPFTSSATPGNYKPPRFEDIDEDACFNDAEADVWVYKKLANKTWRHAINKKHLDLFLARKRLETFKRQMAAAEVRAPITDERPKYDAREVEERRKQTRAGLEAELEGLEGVEREKERRKSKKKAVNEYVGILPGDKAMMEEGYMRDPAGGWRKVEAAQAPQGDEDEPVDFQRGRVGRVVECTKEEEEFWESFGEEAWA